MEKFFCKKININPNGMNCCNCSFYSECLKERNKQAELMIQEMNKGDKNY